MWNSSRAEEYRLLCLCLPPSDYFFVLVFVSFLAQRNENFVLLSRIQRTILCFILLHVVAWCHLLWFLFCSAGQTWIAERFFHISARQQCWWHKKEGKQLWIEKKRPKAQCFNKKSPGAVAEIEPLRRRCISQIVYVIVEFCLRHLREPLKALKIRRNLFNVRSERKGGKYQRKKGKQKVANYVDFGRNVSEAYLHYHMEEIKKIEWKLWDNRNRTKRCQKRM